MTYGGTQCASKLSSYFGAVARDGIRSAVTYFLWVSSVDVVCSPFLLSSAEKRRSIVFQDRPHDNFRSNIAQNWGSHHDKSQESFLRPAHRIDGPTTLRLRPSPLPGYKIYDPPCASAVSPIALFVLHLPSIQPNASKKCSRWWSRSRRSWRLGSWR